MKSTRGRSAEGVHVLAQHRQWRHVGVWENGAAAANFHIGEGIVVAGSDRIWPVVRRDGIRTLTAPSAMGGVPLASYFIGNEGLFNPVTRITLGDSRTGGFDLHGNAWRGSWLTSHGDRSRIVTFQAEGDPAEVYKVCPAAGAPSLPFAVMLLVAYVMIEQDLKDGWRIRRSYAMATGR